MTINIAAMKHLFIYLFIYLLRCVTCVGQEDSAKVQLKKLVEKARNKEYLSGEEKIYDYADSSYIFKILEPYRNDSSANVREFIYNLIHDIIFEIHILDQRQKGINILLRALRDKDPSVRGTTWLQSFRKTDFDDQAKDTIRAIIKGNSYTKVNFTMNMVAGYLELTDLIPVMQKQLIKNDSAFQIEVKKSPWLSKEDILREGFRTHLALARMGVKEEIEYCINLVKRIRKEIYPKDPTNVYYHYIKRDLTYIRRPEVVDYLEELLYDKKFKISPYVGYVLGAYVIIDEIFSRHYIENLPSDKLPSGKYMSKEEYLKFVKKWLKENKGNYKINRDKY